MTNVPMGTIIAYGLPIKNIIGTGWLPCDGSSTTGYTIFSSLPNTPDLRGRTLIGTGLAASGTTYNLKDAKGEEQHTLLNNEMPIHSHNSDNATAVQPPPTDRNTGNNVFLIGRAINDAKQGGVFIPSSQGLQGNGDLWGSVGSTYCTDISGGNPDTMQTDPHNNMQPYYAVNYIIYAGPPSPPPSASK